MNKRISLLVSDPILSILVDFTPITFFRRLGKSSIRAEGEEREPDAASRGTCSHRCVVGIHDLTDVPSSVPVLRDNVPTEVTSGFGPLKTLLETLSAVNVNTDLDVSLRSLQQGHTWIDSSTGIHHHKKQNRTAPFAPCLTGCALFHMPK